MRDSKGLAHGDPQLRIQYPGAIYHIMNRSDRREPIFQDERFLAMLGEVCVTTGWQVAAKIVSVEFCVFSQ